MQHDGVKRPAFVSSCNLLSHGGQEALRVKETSHPENAWAALEYPGRELAVSFQKLGKPETECGRLPRYL